MMTVQSFDMFVVDQTIGVYFVLFLLLKE